MEKGEAAAEEAEQTKPEVYAWGWGAGTDGQLGTGAFQDEHLPQPLPHLPASVSRVVCGGAHAIALTCDGRVLTWGRGTHGQLGHGNFESYCRPRPIKFLENLNISYVSAGWNHSGFITDTGCLFMCGDGSFGQLGNGNNQPHGYPFEVLFFASKHVKQIACGMRHSLALVTGSSGNLIYGFGSGRRGQIGRHLSEGQRTVNLPEVVQGFDYCEIVSIHASGDHSAALSAGGQLYIWGRGFGGGADNHIPRIVPSPLQISQVALGWNHALLMADGLVYMLGGNRHGMLTETKEVNLMKQRLLASAACTTLNESLETLERVHFPGKQKVVSIAAGAEHSVVVTEQGSIMTWGWGEHGQLGLGNTSDHISPQLVVLDSIESCPLVPPSVYCGSGFTIVHTVWSQLSRLADKFPLPFSERVKDNFSKRYGEKAATSVAKSLTSEFGYCVDHPEEISKIAKVKAQVSEVKGVMTEKY